MKCNDLYAGETPALQFFTLRGMKSLAITSELPHTSKSVTGETPVPRWLRGMAVPAMRKLDRSLPAAQGPAQANHLAWQVLSRLECFAE